MIKFIFGLLCLVLGCLVDFLSVLAILTNPEFAGQLLVSWGFVGIGLTFLGIGLFITGRLDETSKLSQ